MKKEVIVCGLILAFLLVIGVEECPTAGIGGGKTQAASYGVDFDFEQGIDKLTSGKIIYPEDTFHVDILIENFDKEAKSGEICIRDDISEAYGGIPSDECMPFTVIGATYFEDKLESPASTTVIFPESGEYSYSNILADIPATFYASLSYPQHSIISGSVRAPSPETEVLQLNQLPAPVEVSAEKTVTMREDEAKLNLKITFTKKGDYNITTADFKKEAIAFSSLFGEYLLDCPDVVNGFIDFKNTKFIRCSAFLPREQTSHPLILTLDYGAKLSKEFTYQIKKEAK